MSLLVFKKLGLKIFYQHKSGVNKEVLRRRDVDEYIAAFHSKFFITPIDKKTSNIGVVCKKIYIKHILKECGL